MQPSRRILALTHRFAAWSLPLPTLSPPQAHPHEGGDARDLAWLRAAAAGDRVAFQHLYRQQHPRLARFLLRFTSRRDLVDDVINDALWVVWLKAATFRGDSKVATWITGIAYRCMLKALRDRINSDEINESALGEVSLEDLGGAANEALDHELADWVARGMQTLSHDHRVTLELAYFMGESCEDIAAIMGCAVGTVKARMFHARMRLRHVLPALGGTGQSKG